ncbi:MAG: hypothetical protein V8Q79_02255 [Christensenellales bacterium]
MINEGKVTGDGSTVTVTHLNNGNSWEETSGELNGWSEGKGSITTVINHGSANSSGNWLDRRRLHEGQQSGND